MSTASAGLSDLDRPMRAWMLVLPSLALLLVLVVYPLTTLIAQSFAGVDPWARYAQLISSPLYVLVLQRTLMVSALTAIFCLLLGYPLAYRMVSAGPRLRAVLLIIILVPFWTNLLVRTYGWMILLNPQGILNVFLLHLGVIERPLRLVYNQVGVIIGMVQIMLPYMVLPLAAVMSRVDPRLVPAAQSLGAGPLRVFFHVYLPMTFPGVVAGLLLVFAVSLGFFVVPAILGGERDLMLAQLIEFNVNTTLNWGFAAALSTVLLGVTLLIYGIGLRWFGLGAVWRMQ